MWLKVALVKMTTELAASAKSALVASSTTYSVAAVTAWYPIEQRSFAERVSAREVNSALADGGPHVGLVRQVLAGTPANVLTEASRGAGMLVLGSHGHSRLRQAALGSVSESCVRNASCPVVVIPATDNRR